MNASAALRVTALTPKPERRDVPTIGTDWLLTIDVSGGTSLYLETWRHSLVRRRTDEEMVRAALDALSQDYFLKVEPSSIPPAELPYAYTCTLSNDALPQACVTLLQLDVKARFVLLIEPRPGYASFAVAASREVGHVLKEYFDGVRSIKPERFRRVSEGRRLYPRRLFRVHLPFLPGIEDATPPAIPLPAQRAATSDEIVLGSYLSPLTWAPVGETTIRLQELNKHTLVAGATGTGKTNTCIGLIQQARPHVKSVLVFDFKRDHRSLKKTLNAEVYGFLGENLFTHNLLKPEGPPALWIKQFSSILSEIISRGVPATGSKDVVVDELDRLFRQRGVYDGGTNYPHIRDLLDALQARAQGPLSDREKNWLASAMRVLKSLTIGSTAQAFCVREGLSIERLLTGVKVIELEGLGDHAAAALLAAVLLQKLRNRLSRDPTEGGLKHLIVIEEAQHLLARGAESASVITDTCREIRSYGVGLIFATQMPSEFSKHAVSNVSTVIAHRLVSPDDKAFMANVLGLDKSGVSVLEKLAVGQALFRNDKLALIRVPRVERPVVHDSELPKTIATREETATDFGARTDVQRRVANLTAREWRLFHALADGEAVHPSGLRDALVYPYKEVSAILRRLTVKGLLGFCPAKKDAGSKARIVYFLRPAGEEAYRARMGRYADRRATASPNHKAAVDAVVAALGVVRKPHARFDILSDGEDREWAVEVETGSNANEDILTNLTKSLAFQPEARFVAADEPTYNRILQVAARHAFSTRTPLLVKVATLDLFLAAKAWDTFEFRPVSPTPL